ncbi:MAG: helix-turn-helix transcriptional regulator [Acidaminococcus fermentans]|nr:helix-turn-helix transcriptional regulator [Acidaminococcus fermentans]
MPTAEELKELFSKRLSALLQENNMNQAELAKLLGVSESTVGKWLLMKSLPRMGIIQKLSDHFGVPKSYFLEENGSKKQAYYLDPETARIAQELHDNPGQRVLFDASKDLSPDDIRVVMTVINGLKKKEGNQ